LKLSNNSKRGFHAKKTNGFTGRAACGRGRFRLQQRKITRCRGERCRGGASQEAAKDSNQAEAKVDDKTNDLNNANAKGAYDVAMAQADGDHKVALQRCDGLSGDSQKACKDQADAKYDLAKANAKAMLAAQKP
jgi:hypothetical protein